MEQGDKQDKDFISIRVLASPKRWGSRVLKFFTSTDFTHITHVHAICTSVFEHLQLATSLGQISRATDLETVFSTMSQGEDIQVTCRPSSMYAILPSVLQLRIPPLAAVQKTIYNYNPRSRKRNTGGLVPRASESEDLKAKGDHTELAVSDQTEAIDTGKDYAVHCRLPHEMPFQGSSPAQIGSHLLNAALVESHQQDSQRQAFSRQLYINGMTYLLQGLPSDLTEQEVVHLQSALPKSLDRSPHSYYSSYKSPNPSVLHRGVATTVMLFCLLLRLTLPYIKYFLAMTYNYERSHHVTEDALTLSINLVNHFSKLGMDVTRTAMNNKPVVEVITYCVDGICGGLNEGLCEGIKAFDARTEP